MCSLAFELKSNFHRSSPWPNNSAGATGTSRLQGQHRQDLRSQQRQFCHLYCELCPLMSHRASADLCRSECVRVVSVISPNAKLMPPLPCALLRPASHPCRICLPRTSLPGTSQLAHTKALPGSCARHPSHCQQQALREVLLHTAPAGSTPDAA